MVTVHGMRLVYCNEKQFTKRTLLWIYVNDLYALSPRQQTEHENPCDASAFPLFVARYRNMEQYSSTVHYQFSCLDIETGWIFEQQTNIITLVIIMDQPKSLCHGCDVFCEIEHNRAYFLEICDSPWISNTLVSFVTIFIIHVNEDLIINRVADYCITTGSIITSYS